MAVSPSEFITALITDVSVFAIIMSLFATLRLLSTFKKFYAPNRFIDTNRKKPKELPNDIFTWVFTLFNYSEKEILETSGMDALVYLRIFKFGIKLFFIISIFSLCTVLPTNLSSVVDPEDTNYHLTGFDKLSVSNVPEMSSKLWVHVATCYFITLYTLWLLWGFHTEAVKLRIDYLASTEMGAESHSVLVTDIPGSRIGTRQELALKITPKFMRSKIIKKVNEIDGMENDSSGSSLNDTYESTKPDDETVSLLQAEMIDIEVEEPVRTEKIETDGVVRARKMLKSGKRFQDMVLEEFQEVYSEESIAAVNLVRDTREVDRVLSTYKEIKRKLEDNIDECIRKRNSNKEIKLRTMTINPLQYGKWAMLKYGYLSVGVKVDMLTFLCEYLNELRKQIRKKQKKANSLYLPAAFVTFKTRYTQTVAALSLHDTNENTWQVNPAPEPREIIWRNLRMRNWEVSFRDHLMWALFWFICLFYFLPVTALQAFIEIDKLDNYPVLRDILSVNFIRSILVAILPGLVLKIFVTLLPYLLNIMGHVAGMRSLSQIDFSVTNKFFIFLVISVFFGSFTSGLFLTQIEQFIHNPGNIIALLGTSAPQTASFFCTYIMLDAFVFAPIKIIRHLDFIRYFILSRMAATERAKERLLQNDMAYGSDSPNHSLTILLGLAFAGVNPIISIITLLYFLIYWFIWKYQLIYVFTEKYQSGGKLWEKVFNQILIALVIMQLMMLGLMGLKKFAYTALIFPLPVITFIFYKIAVNKFSRPLNVLSMRTASDLDKKDKLNKNYDEIMREKSPVMYLSPSFKLDDAEHENLISEAIQIVKSLDPNVSISSSISSYENSEAFSLENSN